MSPSEADPGGQPAPTVRRAAVPQASVAVPQVDGLRRPQLLRALDAVARDRLGVVVAPPGTGKTTLMAQWATTSGLPVAWCRLDGGAAGPGRLVPRLWHALRPHVPPPAGEAPSDPEELALALEQLTQPVLLVLDDLHTLASTTAEAELEQVLLLAPPLLRVLIGSRRMPSFNLARTELAPLVVLTGDDLRFRTWEVETLFHRVHRAPLPPQDVAALTRYTQGWAAALQLFHLSTLGSHPAERRRAVHALAGRARYAQDYLTGQVLAGLPEDMTEFLVRTCVFDALTAARCNALLGTSDSQRVLRELVSRQALTTTTDGGETFVYHEVLRRHLETVLREELGAAGAREWYVRAAQILEDEGDVIEALRARCRAEDWSGVQELLHEFGPRVFDAHHTPRSRDQRWTTLVPQWLTESDPWCCLAEARRLLADGQLDAADAAARRAHSQFTDAAARRLCDDVRATVATWRGGPPPPKPRWADLLLAATQRNPLDVAERARQSEDPRARAVEGFALLLAGDRRAGHRQLRALADEHQDADPALALAAQLALATVAAMATTREGSERRKGPLVAAHSSPFDHIYLEAERHGLSWLARLTSGIATATQGATTRGAAMIGEADARGDRWAAALIVLAYCFTTLRAGTVDTRTLELLGARLRDLGAGVLEVWVAAISALLAAAQQLPDAAQLARAAEAQARAGGVPGASAFAYAALAAAEPQERGEFLALARSTASSSGLDCRPWAWLPDMSPWAREPADDDATPPSDAGTAGPPVAATPPAGAGAAPLSVAATPPSGAGDARPPVALTPPSSATEQAAPGPVVDIRCFGEFRMLVDGREADLTGVRPRVRALLRFLAIHAGRLVHRELIADALWGELDPAAAMHNLQVSLSSLRGALEPGVPGRLSRLVVRDGESYMLALRPGSRCDVAELDHELAAAAHARRTGDLPAQRAALAAVLDLYAGELVPEEGPVDWMVTIRERYRAKVAEAAAVLAELSLAAGDTAAAVSAAQRSVEIDEFRDDAWRVLIAALRSAGEPAAAERAARSYAAVLRDLGVVAPVSHAPGTPPRRPRPGPAAPRRTPRGS